MEIEEFLEKQRKNLAEKGEVFLQVKAIPKMPKNEIVEVLEDGTVKVRVRAVAEKGKANAEILKFLGEVLGVKNGLVIAGATGRVKLVKLW